MSAAVAVHEASNGTHAPHQTPKALLDLGGFHFGTVDEKFRQHREQAGEEPVAGHAAAGAVPSAFAAAPAVQVPLTAPSQQPLGALAGFVGNYAGIGFNTIWRPRNKNSTDPPVPGLTPGTVPGFPNDAVLELNLTTEQLSFSGLSGPVPNRGSGSQPDIPLTAIPYVQKIQDVANPATGKADFSPPIDIHFEPGIWLRVPATTVSPANQGPSLTRMASIPHGTTINAQGAEPASTATITGNPSSSIPVSNITPFILNTPSQPITFPQQTLTNKSTSRLPQNLTLFNAAGTITPAILADPNTVLRNAIAGQNILHTTTFTVSTTASPIVGGGTSSIAFLDGTAASIGANGTVNAPNANSAVPTMTSQFWIETVQWQITVPAGKSFPLDVSPAPTPGHAPLPVWTISGPQVPLAQAKTFTVTSRQIQYSQSVMLNFNGLSWPHVSVATLAQADKIPLIIQS